MCEGVNAEEEDPVASHGAAKDLAGVPALVVDTPPRAAIADEVRERDEVVLVAGGRVCTGVAVTPNGPPKRGAPLLTDDDDADVAEAVGGNGEPKESACCVFALATTAEDTSRPFSEYGRL